MTPLLNHRSLRCIHCAEHRGCACIQRLLIYHSSTTDKRVFAADLPPVTSPSHPDLAEQSTYNTVVWQMNVVGRVGCLRVLWRAGVAPGVGGSARWLQRPRRASASPRIPWPRSTICKHSIVLITNVINP